jgi:hypothetical protein
LTWLTLVSQWFSRYNRWLRLHYKSQHVCSIYLFKHYKWHKVTQRNSAFRMKCINVDVSRSFLSVANLYFLYHRSPLASTKSNHRSVIWLSKAIKIQQSLVLLLFAGKLGD